jgi:integrase
MPRQATGKVIEHVGKDRRTYRALRFTAYGKRRYVTLGTVTQDDAERQLRKVLSEVENGAWQPPEQVAVPNEPEPVPTFHQYAEQWWLRQKLQLAAKTQTDYRWRLEGHLVLFFGEMRLDAITIDDVDRYVAGKLAEGERIRDAAERGKPLRESGTDSLGRALTRPLKALSSRSINMQVTLLGAILESALERDLIARNPARGKGRKLRESHIVRSYLGTAAQIESLLGAAGAIDRGKAGGRDAHFCRRGMLATMTYAGLRIGELCSLRWRDVDLAGGWLAVADAKTDAGVRKVKIRGALRDELLAVRPLDVDQDAFVFATRTGRRQYETKVRDLALAGAETRANTELAARGLPPLPKLKPHSLRRTFATALYALGETPPVVMAEMGHTDPSLALKLYAQASRLSDSEKAQLRALVEGESMGESMTVEQATERQAA